MPECICHACGGPLPNRDGKYVLKYLVRHKSGHLAMYQIVRQAAGPETVYSEITCHACDFPLPNREGKYVLKYFLLRKGGRTQQWRQAGK